MGGLGKSPGVPPPLNEGPVAVQHTCRHGFSASVCMLDAIAHTPPDLPILIPCVLDKMYIDPGVDNSH